MVIKSILLLAFALHALHTDIKNPFIIDQLETRLCFTSDTQETGMRRIERPIVAPNVSFVFVGSEEIDLPYNTVCIPIDNTQAYFTTPPLVSRHLHWTLPNVNINWAVPRMIVNRLKEGCERIDSTLAFDTASLVNNTIRLDIYINVKGKYDVSFDVGQTTFCLNREGEGNISYMPSLKFGRLDFETL